MVIALLGLALAGHGLSALQAQERPYIWTPKPGLEAKLTGPTVFGIRPLSPISFRLTATGKKPIKFSADRLPPGLSLDADTGTFSGSVGFPGTFFARVTAKNSVGSDVRQMQFTVGKELSWTPPMWVEVASAEDVDAVVSKLAPHGWIEAHLMPSADTPELRKAVKDAGLRLSVHSDSIDAARAKALAEAGVDDVEIDKIDGEGDGRRIQDLLGGIGRDMALHVTRETPVEGAQEVRRYAESWRTGAFDGTWASMIKSGFAQASWATLAGRGSWNDPGPLMIGSPTMTPSEQYAQMTLWCLLAAPLRLATRVQDLDGFALSLLTNDEVLAINQDPSAVQANLTFAAGDFEVWSKLLADQTLAIGVFNKGDAKAKATLDFGDPKVKGVSVRDLWKQEKVRTKSNILPLEIQAHGAMLFKTDKNLEFRFRLGHDPKPPKGAGGGISARK